MEKKKENKGFQKRGPKKKGKEFSLTSLTSLEMQPGAKLQRVLKAVIGLASRLLNPNLLGWEAALAVLPKALEQVLGRLFYAFPCIREVWNSCPGSGQPAAAMKTHLAKYIGLIEEERAIAFLTRRMATAAWKDRSDISFLSLLHSLPHKTVAPTVRQAVLKWAFDEGNMLHPLNFEV